MEPGRLYGIRIAKTANKYLARCEADLQERFREAFLEIRKSPEAGQHIKRLKGERKGQFRYDFGGYRVIYTIGRDELIVYVVDAGPRGDIYK